MIGAAGEIVLPRRARLQPRPEIHQGGDCGACVLGGVLDLEVAEIYRRFDSKGLTHLGEMQRCLRCAASDGIADRIVENYCTWRTYMRESFGHPAFFNYLDWFNYVRMAIDAGYYGLAEVDMHGDVYPDTNHWILICGARTKGCVMGETLTGEILVSCSVSGERWWEAREFLKTKGGFCTLFARPKA